MTDEKPPSGGQELTNWRLSRIEEKIDGLGQNYVPIGIYNVNQKNIEEAFGRSLKADSDNAAATAALAIKFDNQQEQIDKNRKQFWVTVSSGGFLLIMAIFVTPIARALGLTP